MRDTIRGTIQHYLTIWCGYGDCQQWEHLTAKGKREGGKEARARGWTLTGAFGWICPECSKECPKERYRSIAETTDPGA